MEIENLCEQCNKITENSEKLSCGHFLCPDCLSILIFVHNLRQLSSQEEVTVHCKCKSGLKQFSLSSIHNVLSLCTDKCANCKNLLVKHHCSDCKLWFCEKCNEIHNTINPAHQIAGNDINANQINLLTSQLGRIDKISGKFKENNTLTITRTNEKIDALIETLEQAKLIFSNKMTHINENEDKFIKIMQMFYSKYYSAAEKCLTTNDILQLKDLTFFKYYLTSLGSREGLGTVISNFYENITPLKSYLNKLKYPLHACWTNNQCWKNTITISDRYNPVVVVCLIQLKDGRIVGGCNSGILRIWEVTMDDLKHALDTWCHINTIFALLQLKDGRVISGGSDSTLKIWNIKDFKNPLTLTGHTSCINAVILLQDGRIASASWDNTIKIWEEVDNSFQNTLTLTGHTSKIATIIQLKDGRLASGSYDQTVRIWEIRQREFQNVVTLNGQDWMTHLIYQLKDGRVITVSLDRIMRLWNVSNVFINLMTMPLDNFGFQSIRQLEDGRILTSGNDNTIKFWDVTDSKFINTLTLTGHSRCVYSVILLQDGRLASVSDDRTVRIWDSCVLSFD